MKIDNSVFDPNIQKEQPFAKANYGASFAEVAKAKVDAFDKAQKVGQSGYDKEEVTGKSAIEELQQKMENESMSAGERKNQMAVLSNTLSPEDYRKLQEEGFSIHETDPLWEIPLPGSNWRQLEAVWRRPISWKGNLPRQTCRIPRRIWQKGLRL